MNEIKDDSENGKNKEEEQLDLLYYMHELGLFRRFS